MPKKRNFFKLLNITLLEDRNFLKFVYIIERLVAKILSMALIIVIVVSIADLLIFLFNDLFDNQPFRFVNRTLIDIFGLFLNILIALELLENITAYLKKHILQVELVVVTALIAVARKVIIFDLSKYDKSHLTSLGIAIFALAASYGIIRWSNGRLIK